MPNKNDLKQKLQDYIQEQRLDISLDSTYEKAMVLSTIEKTGSFDFDDQQVWRSYPTEYGKIIALNQLIEATKDRTYILKKIYALLDIVFSENPQTISASCFLALNNEYETKLLFPNCQFGPQTEMILEPKIENISGHLTIRVYFSGWLTIIGNSDEWLLNQELTGHRHHQKEQQWCVPILDSEQEQGIAILYAEGENIDDWSSILEWWVALAIVLENLLVNL
ncbi:hypothetical protein GKC56_06105 [Neisseriaceae bacterium PsAf]|nr:hypothetical protein [Neisseriaceae bacterium PsAf]